MADKIVNIQASTPVEKDFQQVHDIVVFHHSEVARKVNTEMLQMAWEIGQYISARIKSASWGAKVVDELSEYLQQQEPGSRGFGRRNLYNMVTFYDKYSTPEFCEIAKSLTNSLFVQRKTHPNLCKCHLHKWRTRKLCRCRLHKWNSLRYHLSLPSPLSLTI